MSTSVEEFLLDDIYHSVLHLTLEDFQRNTWYQGPKYKASLERLKENCKNVEKEKKFENFTVSKMFCENLINIFLGPML